MSKQLLRTIVSALLVMVFTVTSVSAYQPPAAAPGGPDFPPGAGGHFWQNTSPERPVAQPSGEQPPELDMALGQIGAPGLSYRYVKTLGVLNQPYLPNDGEYLNRPNNLLIDPADDSLFVTELNGYRFLKFGADKALQWAFGQPGVPDIASDKLSNPGGAAIAPDGNIWVSDWTRLVVLDPDGQYVADFPESEPWAAGQDAGRFDGANAVAFDDLGHMFVSEEQNQRVQIFDWVDGSAPTVREADQIGVTREEGSDLDHLKYPRDIAVAPNGLLYIMDTDNNRVLRCPYDQIDDEWVCGEFITDLPWATGIELTAAGELYIPLAGTGQIMRCTDANQSESCDLFVVDSWGFRDIAVDSDGLVYASDDWGSRIFQFDTDGTQITDAYLGTLFTPYLTDSQHFNWPRVYFDKDGSMLVLEEAGQRLVKFSPSGAFLWSYGTPGHDSWDISTFNNPRGLDTDAAGNIYVADNFRVQVIDKNGNYVRTIGPEVADQPDENLSIVSDLAIDDSTGQLYVADRNNHRVLIYSTAGAKLGQIGATGDCLNPPDGLCGPHALAFDSAGSLYISQTNSIVTKYNLARQRVMTIGVLDEYSEGHGWFNNPSKITIDGAGRILVTDMYNHRVEVFNPSGAYLATIGGVWGDRGGEFRHPSQAAVDPQGQVYVSELGSARIQVFAVGVPGWVQKNINGFGQRFDAGVSALEVYNNQVYAATSNWTDGDGGSIWRTTDWITWTRVAAPGMVARGDSPSITDLQVFNGYLYVTTAWGGNMARLYRYNGSTWEKVLEQPGNGYGPMTVFKNTLYVGEIKNSGETGARIWRSSTGAPNLAQWTAMLADDPASPGNDSPTDLFEFNGRLFAAMNNSSTGIEILRLKQDGSAWEVVADEGLGHPEANDPGAFGVWNGMLYISGNGENGAFVRRSSDGVNWTAVNDNGFGNPNNQKVESFISHFDRMYAVTLNEAEGSEVWSTTDGVQWRREYRGGFGDVANYATLWNSATLVHQGVVYLGTWNQAKGGQIWQLVKDFNIYLPIARK